jgi:hypothetical protein
LQEHKAVLNYQQQTMDLLPFIKEKTAD